MFIERLSKQNSAAGLGLHFNLPIICILGDGLIEDSYHSGYGIIGFTTPSFLFRPGFTG